MKIGEIAVPEKAKFLQEEVVEALWPFNRLPYPRNLVALTFAYFWWAVFLLLFFGMSLSFFIVGSIAAVGIVIWTWGIFNFADNIRNREFSEEEMNRTKLRIIQDFATDVFKDVSVVVGIFFYVGIVTFFFTYGKDSMAFFVGDPWNFMLLLFFLLVLFDACYRLGLTGYLIFMIAKRNIVMSRYLRRPELRAGITIHDIDEFRKSDRTLFLVLFGTLFLLPAILYMHPFASFVFLGFVLGISIILISSILYLDFLIPRLEKDSEISSKGHELDITSRD